MRFSEKTRGMRALIAFIFITIHTILSGQNQENAILVLPVNSFDFGPIPEDKGKVNHKFFFTNAGTEPLIINNVRTTCGCTVPSWTKDPVLPGNEGFIDIEFDPKGRPGAFHKTVQIQSAAQNANMFLTISGMVMPPPERVDLPYKLGDLHVKSNHVNLGYLYKGDTGSENLIVANHTSHDIEVGFIEVPPHIMLFSDPQVLHPEEYGQIEVRYNTEKIDDWDVVVDQIPVIINGKRNSNVKLTVTANIREDFRSLTQEQIAIAPIATYTADSMNYDTITRNDPVEYKFLVRNDGQSDLVIRAVKASCGCTAVKPAKNILAPGDSAYIDAVFYPEGRSGDFKNGITIVTNDPRLYKKYLFLEGYIKN